MQLIASKERFATLTSEVATLEARLVALTQELSNKQHLVQTAQHDMEETGLRIKRNQEKQAGLCIR